MAALMLLGGASLAAQQPVPAKDTAKVASAPDSTAVPAKVAADTVKAPLARAELPVELGGRLHWSGEALRATGAVTLADLLARIPGATSFRANWIPAAQYIAWNGDAGRVRVFFDGVEQDAIDPRNGAVLDLAMIPLWAVEEASVERAPGELRVHLRSWRVDRVVPLTRTDITTGSENTNLYRGYFGKRLHNGGAVQLAAQQYNTTSSRLVAGDGSSAQVFGRVGWAWKRWGVDGTWSRSSVDRAASIRWPLSAAQTYANGSPAFKGALGTAYARVAWGDPDVSAKPWVQLIAATQMVAENSNVSETTTLTDPTAVPKDTVDSASSRSQYVLAAGASRWGITGSVTARLRASQGRTDLSQSARLGYAWRFVSLSAYAETRGADSTGRLDASVRVTPWRWLELSGAVGSYRPKSALYGPSFTASRVDASGTWLGLTLTGGMLTRGATTLAPPIALDSSLVRVGSGEAKGVLIALRGPIYRAIALDVSAVRWDGSGAYRPQMEVHSAVGVNTSWLSRFPRNNFHILAAGTYAHRTPMFFPAADGQVGPTAGTIDIIGARLEIRIESGTVFFQAENTVGKSYETAPGYLMPRRLQYYGLRWEFWN